MGPLALALGNDVSIQRLPEISINRTDGNVSNAAQGHNEQAFYSSQADLQKPMRLAKDDISGSGVKPHRDASFRSTTSGITANEYLVKSRIAVPESLVNQSVDLKQILRHRKH